MNEKEKKNKLVEYEPGKKICKLVRYNDPKLIDTNFSVTVYMF